MVGARKIGPSTCCTGYAPACCPNRSSTGGPHPCRSSPEGGLHRKSCARRPRAVSSGDMSPNGRTRPAPAGGWLEGDQRRAWLAYIRVQLRLAYEMNRQLLADSGLSLPDYDVLTAL